MGYDIFIIPPAKTEAKNRLRWALELAKEQDEQRQRLGEFAGVKLVYEAPGPCTGEHGESRRSPCTGEEN